MPLLLLAGRPCLLLQQACRRRFSSSAAAAAPPQLSAAFMAIGDELLSGSVTDVNLSWLAQMLHSRGVDLVRAEFVPDDKADIVATLQRLKERVGPEGVVFSSGGIGPTHDDVSYEAVATALGVSLELHEPTRQRMQDHYGPRGVELNAARLRMATLPTPCEVLVTEGLWVPLVHVQGVYVLPGIPRLFKQMLGAHQERFKGPPFLSESVFTNAGEGDLAVPLQQIVDSHPEVTVGSYPYTGDPAKQQFGVKIQLSGRSSEAVQAALAQARSSMDVFDLPS